VIYLEIGLEELIPQNILVGRAGAGNASVDDFYLLPITGQLFLETTGEKALCFYVSTFYEGIPQNQNAVVVVRGLALPIMKSQIVCFNQILVLIVIHESDMRRELENPIVIQRHNPRIA
jgi:hypothetical protein